MAEAFPGPDHNHKTCVASALERARAAFEAKGLRLTTLRQQVFDEIAASHTSIGAYDILQRLAAKGTRLAPISVYRAIEALTLAGVVHRLECKNAYFACHTGHGAGVSNLVLACDRCGRVAEVEGGAIFDVIDAAAADSGFVPRARIVEVAGVCRICAARGEDRP